MADKLIPFGEISESFTGLKDDGIYYIDKTGFIPFILEQKRKICVFTRPRRFGKTLMLRTLQTFFEYRLDDAGTPVDNRRYFEGLKVMDAGEDVLKYMGKYPVISLSFKDVRADTFALVIAQLRGAVSRACTPYESLLKESGILGAEQAARLQRYLDRLATEEELMQFLEIITDWLYKATKRTTVILLDEYDVPLQQAAIYDNRHPGSDLFEKTVKFVGNFISSGFKSNDNLAYGVISGCMRVAKDSIFTGMNNPGIITVLDEIPDEYWGFTEDEVQKMLAYYGLEDQMDVLKYWYDGYDYSDREVYNPWSVLNAIRGLVNGHKRAIQAYWVRTSGNDIIDDMIERNPEHRTGLARLMNGETMIVPVYENLSYRDLKENPEAIWSFLLYTGYLKSVFVNKNERNRLQAEIAIPNEEVRTLMDASMERWWKNVRIAQFDAHNLMQAFWEGDTEGIVREIGEMLSEGISVYDAKEAFYHGMMLGILRTQCQVKSNREHGEGRPDIVAMQGRRALILELKCISPSEIQDMPLEQQFVRVPVMMNKRLDEAELQIKARYYIEGLKFEEPQATEVRAYAVCFCKKRCVVRSVSQD